MEKKKYKTEETGHYSGVIPKMTVMQPQVINVSNPPEDQSVASQEMICAHSNPDYFQTCKHYNTTFCLNECVFRADKIDSFDFDNREDGK